MVMLATAELRTLGITPNLKREFYRQLQTLAPYIKAERVRGYVPVAGAPEQFPWEGGTVVDVTSMLDTLLADDEYGLLEVRTSDALAMGCCTDRLRFAHDYFDGQRFESARKVWEVGKGHYSSSYVQRTVAYVVLRHMLATGKLPWTTEMVRDRYCAEARAGWLALNVALSDLPRGAEQPEGFVQSEAYLFDYYRECVSTGDMSAYNYEKSHFVAAEQRRAEVEQERERREEERRLQRVREQEERERQQREREARRATFMPVVDMALQAIANTEQVNLYTLQTVRGYLLSHMGSNTSDPLNGPVGQAYLNQLSGR